MQKFKLKNNNVIKGMVFAGCSFTWGQGLYFYSNLSTLVEPKPHHYDHKLVKETHMAYMRSVRYSRQVANHFNKYEITQPFNGGSHESITNWWKASFNNDMVKRVESTFEVPKINYSDVSHMIFQFTQPHRCPIVLTNNEGKDYQICFNEVFFPENRDNFTRWLEKNNLTLDEYETYYINESNNRVKELLQTVESHGVKTFVLTWPKENIPYIKNDSWLSERFIDLTYNGLKYDSIQEMMHMHPELEIIRDQDSFEVTPGDHHPSLRCHNVIAENIINYLEKHDSTI